jgi:hypothetical protein
VASWAHQLGNADREVVPTIAWVDSEGYRGTPLRLRGNVIARLIRPQPERASLACPAVEPNTRAGLFLWWPSEAQGRPLTGIADAMRANGHWISHERGEHPEGQPSDATHRINTASTSVYRARQTGT